MARSSGSTTAERRHPARPEADHADPQGGPGRRPAARRQDPASTQVGERDDLDPHGHVPELEPQLRRAQDEPTYGEAQARRRLVAWETFWGLVGAPHQPELVMEVELGGWYLTPDGSFLATRLSAGTVGVQTDGQLEPDRLEVYREPQPAFGDGGSITRRER